MKTIYFFNIEDLKTILINHLIEKEGKYCDDRSTIGIYNDGVEQHLGTTELIDYSIGVKS